MKEVIYYECDNCDTHQKSRRDIFMCWSCGAEICIDCAKRCHIDGKYKCPECESLYRMEIEQWKDRSGL